MVDKQKILIVDDDANIAELISLYLMKECYETRIVGDGESALREFPEFKPNLVLLDLMLPGIDGYQVCRELRISSQVPIIMLSAKGEIFDKVLGLELGADDYITKPFSTTELIARVESLYRRVDYSKKLISTTPKDSIVLGNFELDLKKHKLFKNGEEIELTQIEYNILECFFNKPEESIEPGVFLEKVWGEKYYGDDKVVDVNIRRLRLKIEDDPSNPEHLITVWGQGYRWIK